MGKYDTAKIRNLGIVAQGDAGKTSLTEAMLFNTGMTDRLGKVDDGSSTMDFEPEEVKRHITISSKLHHCEWEGHSLHLVDTPGYTNFLHDTRNCLRILGGAVLVVSAVDGVKAQTNTLWKWMDEFEVPRIAFVNKLDRERADYLKAVDDLEKSLGTRAVAVNMPMGAEDNFKGVIDLVNMKARVFQFDDKGTYQETEIPAEYQDEADRLHLMLVEAAAEADDELMEKYLETDSLTHDEVLRGLREGTLTNVFTPVLCGSATANIGVRQLLDYITYCLPSPIDKGTQHGVNPKSGEAAQRQPSPDEPFSAMVFKTISDPYAGKLTLFRIYSGTLKPDTIVYNPNKETTERIAAILEMEGKKQKTMNVAEAGDICAVAKLKETETGDTLCDGAKPILYESPVTLKPVISFALEAKSKGDEDKIHSSLKRLMEEDPTLQVQRDEETKEMILAGMGQVHVEVAVEKLKRKFGVEVVLKEPKVPYRETIKKTIEQAYRHKKQSGGKGQFADVNIKLAQLPRGGGYDLVDKIVTATTRQLRQFDVDVCELTLAAGLFLVPVGLLDGFFDGFAIGDLGFFQDHFDAELALEFFDSDLDMHLAHPGQDHLLGFLVPLHLQSRVLLHQPLERTVDLVFIPFALGFQGERNHRLQRNRALVKDRLGTITERVTGLGLLELGYGADIAGLGNVHGLLLLAFHFENGGNPLGSFLVRVVDDGVRLQGSRVNSEQSQLAGIGIADGLENHGREGFVRARLTLRSFATLRVDPVLGSLVDRRRQAVGDVIE